MESVGQQLRDARLRIGLAPQDVSAKTRITLKSIQAIEDDDLMQINSIFFYKSFVRQFADVVGIDQRELAPAMEAAVALLPEPLVPGQAGAPARPDLPGLKPQRTRKTRWLISVASLVVMLVACSDAYDVWQKSRAGWHPPARFQSAPSPAPSDNNPAATGNSISDSANPADPLSAVPGSPRQTPNREAVHVQLSAVERTWLSVAADGRQVFSGTLQADETKTLEGHETARIHTGNAGGIEVVFNGRTIGRLGRKGEVRTVVFTKNGYNFTEPREHVALNFIRDAE